MRNMFSLRNEIIEINLLIFLDDKIFLVERTRDFHFPES